MPLRFSRPMGEKLRGMREMRGKSQHVLFQAKNYLLYMRGMSFSTVQTANFQTSKDLRRTARGLFLPSSPKILRI
jgi:hypothetical protein